MDELNRVKIYADVDGTLAVGKFHRHLTAEVVVQGHALTIRWRPDVVEPLAALSHLRGIEWWWLTAWGADAVTLLDPLWGINSAGVIDWAEPFGDWMHVTKRRAVIADQELDPTPFVWMDDVALQKLEEGSPLRRGDSLLISVNDLVGVTLDDVEAVKEFLAAL